MDTTNNIPSGPNDPQETVTQSPSVTPSNSFQNTHQNHSSRLFGKWIIIIIIFICLIEGITWYLPKILNQQKPQLQISQNDNQKGVLYVGENIDEDGLAVDTKEFQPFINYLLSKLGTYGYTKAEFVGTTSVSEMAGLVREGKIDIIIDSAFPVYVVSKLAGTQVIADRWKGGVGTYHSAIFVKKESTINTLDDLKGKILAFDSTTSTVGYFLPKAELIKEGYTLLQKKTPSDSCPSTAICYVFVHGNVYENVAKGIVPAGAESELEIDGYFGKSIINYRIIKRLPDIPRFLVATSSNLNPSMTNTIKNTLFTMDQSSEGRTILKSFADTAKFTPVANNDASYGVIKDLSDLVEAEIIQQ